MADGSLTRVTDAEYELAEPPDDANPLFDHRAERGVLAAVLLDEGDACGVWRKLSTLLTAAHFHEPRHATIWSAFEAVRARGESLDVLTAAAELKARNRLNAVGGAQYLGELTEYIPTLVHCESHANILVKAHARRLLVEAGTRIARAAADGTKDPLQVRDLAIEWLRRVSVGSRASAPSDATSLLSAMWSHIEDGIAGKRPGPLPFGVSTLDRMSGGGMKRGGTYFLAARPGLGKTTLACQITAATTERGERALYVALEPQRVEVMQSIVANRAGVALTKITRAPQLLSQLDMDALAAASNAVDGWPVHVVNWDDSEANTVAKVEAAMRALPTMPALVVVDHYLKLAPVGRYAQKHDGAAEVVASLVALGKRTGATILVLCHIGRGVSSSNSSLFRKPRTEDIAGGDAMNRDADGIVLMHREDKYPTKKDSIGNRSLAGVVDLLAPKLRGVEDNTFGRMRFRGEVQRFEALAEEPAHPPDAGGYDDYGGSP